MEKSAKRKRRFLQRGSAVFVAHERIGDYLLPNSRERCAALLTASIKAARKPFFSKVLTASMVVPPGEQTLSLKSAGCSPLSITSLAAPKTV
jgi:hypothetical protein